MFVPMSPSIFPERLRPNLDMNTDQELFPVVGLDVCFGEHESLTRWIQTILMNFLLASEPGNIPTKI